ncbi:putative ATP-dependent carboligase related to biotin carboxylase [Archaeoglobus sulfaticallidus PM70-1]|uniref:Putative ATP-dependent carboligase related to biotin carboxylase n=1 Tax=Archaeoglobus sulfaticallidus PM70-1 TaxID=387631 RepID=N0BD62_9EURY|nr:ATP-grasp domain-containing protein [Archaeoglobus sulfaticallidus]AGK61539.1 putative ATP-dependent carboligase related to biotin carboxylase [Archaeoglobus sulfaticallidus PM70-1]
MERILVVGNNVRNVVQSAFKSGFEVYALTKFVDSDLALFSKKVYLIEEESREWVLERANELAERYNARVVLASGYEDIEVKADVLGCEPSKIHDVVDKLKFYRKLESAGLPFPELKSEVDGRVIVKPIRGGGGEDIKLLENEICGKDFLIQEYIEGFPCSASLIVGKDAEVISLNRILAGWSEMNADGFRYSGNTTPLDVKQELRKKLSRLAVELCELFELKGSVGVDFVVDRNMNPYIIEMNPRFQGSLDAIEWSMDVSLFRLHYLAVEGKKVEVPKARRFAGRFVLFADRTIEIRRNLFGNPFFADIPFKGTVYQKDDPVVSILCSGNSESDVMEKAVDRRNLFLKLNHSA